MSESGRLHAKVDLTELRRLFNAKWGLKSRNIHASNFSFREIKSEHFQYQFPLTSKTAPSCSSLKIVRRL
ncbi:protein of unknown function [Hyphomicrobium sp. 1Nfss2.1]